MIGICSAVPMLVSDLLSLSSAFDDISYAPRLWPKYLHGTRRLVLQRFPFSVVYLDNANVVNVVAVAHNKRRPGYWKDRL
jgi:toxin ParE1/3/4